MCSSQYIRPIIRVLKCEGFIKLLSGNKCRKNYCRQIARKKTFANYFEVDGKIFLNLTLNIQTDV